jgi:hypothetical protein
MGIYDDLVLNALFTLDVLLGFGHRVISLSWANAYTYTDSISETSETMTGRPGLATICYFVVPR